MNKELFFDIVSDEWAAGLYRIKTDTGEITFHYHHSLSDLEDEDNKTQVSETNFSGFREFWKEFTRNNRWFTFHPLFIHPEQRPFIKDELKKIDWKIIADEKWRDMYQRQWNKVLNGPPQYYKPLQP